MKIKQAIKGIYALEEKFLLARWSFNNAVPTLYVIDIRWNVKTREEAASKRQNIEIYFSKRKAYLGNL